MKESYIIENHNESLHIWRALHKKNATVLHFDSHHDMYDAGSTPWISNYLLFALAENIIDTLYIILPRHIFSLPDKLTSVIASVHGIKRHEKVRSNLYRIWLKHCASCIYFCDYSALPNSFDGEVLLDIDVDYFIYSCTGCLIKGSSYCINMEVLEQLPQIKFLSHQAHITTISLSVFGGYVPIEFQFLGSWLEEYFFTTSGEEALKELEIVAELYNRNKCISYKLHYIPGPAVSLLNACSSYKIGCYRRSANFFSGVSQGFISKYRNFLTNWEYFFFLRGDECLRCSMEEINKYLIWLNDSELYNQKRAWLYYRLERYQEMCDIVETLQQENIHTTFLRAVLAYHLHNWDSFYKYRNQLFACCKDVLGVKEITAYSDYEKLRLFSEAMHLA